MRNLAGDALSQHARVARAQAGDIALALRVGHGIPRYSSFAIRLINEDVELLVYGDVASALDDGEEDMDHMVSFQSQTVGS